MAKESQSGLEDSVDPEQGSAARIHGHATNWEKRLHDARIRRERLLAAKKAGASTCVDPKPEGDVEPPAPVTGAEAESASAAPLDFAGTSKKRVEVRAGRMMRVSASMASKALLVFSGMAGLGFGIVLGFGVLRGSGNAPTQMGSINASNEETADPAPNLNPIWPDPATTDVSTKVLPKSASASKSEADQAFPEGSRISAALGLVAPEPDAVRIDLPVTNPVEPQVPREKPPSPIPDTYPPSELPSLAGDPTGPGESESKLQFVMYVPSGVSDTKLRGYVTRLEDSGVEIAEIGREGFRVSATHLRFYSSDNADLARSVANDLGVEARDFSQNKLVPDLIEIWIAGRPRARSTENEAVAEPPGRSIQSRNKLSANR